MWSSVCPSTLPKKFEDRPEGGLCLDLFIEEAGDVAQELLTDTYTLYDACPLSFFRVDDEIEKALAPCRRDHPEGIGEDPELVLARHFNTILDKLNTGHAYEYPPPEGVSRSLVNVSFDGSPYTTLQV
jgi:hypothetical protein